MARQTIHLGLILGRRRARDGYTSCLVLGDTANPRKTSTA